MTDEIRREALMVSSGVPGRDLYRDGKRIKVWGY